MGNGDYREEALCYHDVVVDNGDMANTTLRYEAILWTSPKPTAQGGRDMQRGAAI